jgi:catechol 2,3-dioxygenase-like lactoylglutathione lyase family enzyme
MKLTLERVHHAQITVPKGSENSAKEFYCDLLGLKEVPKPESLQGRGGFWLELGDFQIHVGTENDFDHTKTKAHIAYQVENLEACRAQLSSKGIKILEGVPIPGYERFEFRDPFGNRVEFLQKI